MTLRIFVTGATGYVGSAVVGALLDGGHEVWGLTSSDERAAELEARGVHPVVGGLGDPGSWRKAASRADALVHAAFDYGAEDPVEIDGLAIDTLLSAAGEGSGSRSFAYTSGVWVLGNTGDQETDESTVPAEPFELVAWRPAHEQVVLEGRRRVTPAVIRPGVLYGGRRGLMVRFFQSAEDEGAATYIGDGRNRMALVHRDDVGRLYRMAIEEGATGILHAVDGAPMAMVDVARAASQAAGAGGEIRSVPLEEARQELGPVADALCLDQVVAPRRSAELLGWVPDQASFRQGAELAFQEWRGGREE